MVELTGENFHANVVEAAAPVLVCFYTDEAGPCRALEPTLEDLEKNYDDCLSFARCNINDNHDVAIQNAVMSVPAIVLFNKGTQLARKNGYGGQGNTYRWLARTMEELQERELL